MYDEMLYIASPLRGDVERNIENALRYCARAIEEGAIPLAPHAMYRGIFDDEIPERRAMALELGRSVLEKCSRMWVCGDRISEGMRGEIELAQKKGIPVEYKSEAYFTKGAQENKQEERPHTFAALRDANERAVSKGLQSEQNVRRLLSLGVKHYGHSISNAAAIHLQKPDAQFTLPYHEWHKLGFHIKDPYKSVKVWASTPSADGTRTVYRMQALYDISQTDCPKNQYERVMATPYSHLEYSELYASLKTAVELTGFPVKEIPNAQAGYRNGEITVSNRTHPAQQLASLTDSYARGIVAQSSSQPPNIQSFEANALSFLLQNRFGVPDQLMTAGPSFSPEGLRPESFGRVQRMLQHTERGLQNELRRQNLDIDAPLRLAQRENNYSQKQQEINRNFTREL